MASLLSFLLLFIMFPYYSKTEKNSFTILYDDQEFSHEIQSLKKTMKNAEFIPSSLHESLIRVVNDTRISSHDVVFSFTKNDELFKTVVQSNEFYGFATSGMELASRLVNTNNMVCRNYSRMFFRTMTFLIYSLSVKGLAIISDQHYCTSSFAYQIHQQLQTDEKTKNLLLNLRNFTITQPLHDTSKLRDFLYTMRTIDIPIIILLTQHKIHHMVFELASHYGLTGTFQTWLIPHYKPDAFHLTKHEPLKILTYYDANVTAFDRWLNLEDNIPKLMDTYDRSSDVDMNARLLKLLFDEEDVNITEFQITVAYRNKAEKNSHWAPIKATVRSTEFLLEHNTIPILRSVWEQNLHRQLRAVFVFDEPFNMDSSIYYDPIDQSCSQGMVCKKMSQNINGSLSYEPTCCNGFIIDVFEIIRQDLNLRVDMYLVKDGKYGAKQDGQWNGMIGEVARGNFDIAIAGLTITEDRLEVVDYTVPFLYDKMGVLVKPEVVTLDFINWEFISPLSNELKMVFFACVILLVFVNFAFENNVYFISILSGKLPIMKYYSFRESMSYVVGVTLQRDLGGVNPVRPGARIGAVVFAFGMVIVVTTYTAVLAAQSVRNEEKDPFNGSQDPRFRNPSTDFRFGSLKSSSYETFFKNGETEILKRMHRFMQPYNFDSTAEAVEKVKNGSLEAIINDYHVLHYFLSKDHSCLLRLSPDNLLSFGLGFALQKNSPYKVLIDQVILKHVEIETISTISRKWFTNICQPSIFATANKQLTLNTFGGIVFLLFITLVISILCLYPEHLYQKFMKGKLWFRIMNRCKRNSVETMNNSKNTLEVYSTKENDRGYSLPKSATAVTTLSNMNAEKPGTEMTAVST